MNSNEDNDNDNRSSVKIKKSYSVKFNIDDDNTQKESYADCIIQDRTRSKSHMSFKYRPEMVPIIKPKQSSVKPSPMKLHYIAEKGIDVVDLGVPVISMHAPFEVISKADLFMTYKAFVAFNEAE